MGQFMDMASAFQDFMFTSSRSGTFYALVDYLVLRPVGAQGQPVQELKIPFPCQISVNGRCKVVVTEVDGLMDTVKEDMGFSGYDLNISFEAGDYGVLPWMNEHADSVPKATEIISELATLVSNHKGLVEITEGAQISYEHRPSRLAPTIEEIAAGLEGETPQPEAKQPLLAALGIRMMVFQTIAINPTKNHRYQVTLTAVAELDEKESDSLFPTVQEAQSTAGQSQGGAV